MVRVFIILLLLKASTCIGQPNRFAVQSYGLQQGMLQTTMNDAAFDALNFMWVGYPNGIQKFNGIRFIEVPVQAGLPDTKWVRFFRLSTGDLLVAHSKGISRYRVKDDRFVQIFKNAVSDIKVPEFIDERNGVLWFYSKKLGINGLHIASNKTTGFTSFETIIGKNIDVFGEINILNKFHLKGIVLNAGNIFYLWNPDQKGEVVTVNVGFPFFGNRSASYIMPDYKVQFYGKHDASSYVLNFADGSVKKVQEGKFREPLSLRGFYTNWQGNDLVAFQNRIYYFDEKLQKSGAELLDISGGPVVGEHGIQQILVDNYQNLYFRTTSGGFKKISYSNTAISYYGTSQKRDNYILSVLPDKKTNRILVGTRESGLVVYDTLKNIVRHIKNVASKQQIRGINAISKTTNGDYLLYVVGESMLWRLSADLKTLIPSPKFSKQMALPAIGYFNTVLQNNSHKILTYSEGRLSNYSPILNKGSVHFFSSGISEVATLYRGRLVIQRGDELLFIDTATNLTHHKIILPGTGGVRCFAEKDDNLYIGTNKGVFIISKVLKVLKQYDASSGLPDECVYAMAFDRRGRLWCSTNKGIFAIKKDESIFQLTMEDGLQDNEFNTGVVAVAPDGELYFGGVNGVSSFYPDVVLEQKEQVKLLVTDIRIANKRAIFDKATWQVKEITLPWNKNVLSFDFLAMGQKSPSQYIHQYKMDGVDKEWAVNKDLQTVRYHLPPGKYAFNIFASTSYTATPLAMKQISITIQPPFYKSWWFLTLLVIILLTSLVFVVNAINNKKHKKALQALQEANRIQLERERISRDLHDNVGLHANTILYNTELLELQPLSQEVVNSLRFAAKDIIASLRETVWAFKKESYSAEECLLRIRNYVQALKDHYPHIEMKVLGQAPQDKLLSHGHALNLVRIVQEAITNVIKHAEATNININANAGEHWVVSVEDNGKGFNTGLKTDGNGLENIQYRAKEAGFDVRIRSQHTGTLISITIH